MDVNIKENVEKMLNAGKENGSIKTTTITQLLNDLGIYSEEQYNEIIELIEERRHLTEIGKQGIHKEAYLTALETIGRNCEDTVGTGGILQQIMEDIEQLCEKFNIKDKNIKDKEIDEIELEK